MISIAAFQAIDPATIPGHRNIFLILSIINPFKLFLGDLGELD